MTEHLSRYFHVVRVVLEDDFDGQVPEEMQMHPQPVRRQKF